MSDFMELGDSGLVAGEKGWLIEKSTGNHISPDGRVYSKNGEYLSENYWDDGEEEYEREAEPEYPTE